MKKTSSKMLLTTAFILLFSSQNFVNGLGQVSVSENRIVNVRDPIDKTDVATKNYVDNKIEGIQTPPVVLQTEGKSETAVMSQKAVSSIVSKQRKDLQEHIDKTVNQKLINTDDNKVDPNDISLKTGTYIPRNINLPINDSNGILENKVVYNSDGSLAYILQYFYRYKENETWKRTYNTVVDSQIVNTWTEWVNTSENAIFDKIYPVGSIYMSVNSVNPSSLFGGAWSAWGQGRVPVGVGSNGTTNYTTSETTGGNAEHRHDWRIATHWWYGGMCGEGVGNSTGAYVYSGDRYDGWARSLSSKSCPVNTAVYNSQSSVTGKPGGKYSQGDTSATSTMQPYITCYMWKRIA